MNKAADHPENIFDKKPTDAELTEMDSRYVGMSLPVYMDHLKLRGERMKTSQDFERFVDLQDLMNIRGDDIDEEIYRSILQKDFADIMDKQFDE